MRLHVGIDVGAGRHDRTAIVVVETLQEARQLPTGPLGELRHVVVHLERMASLTPLDVQAARIVKLAATPEMEAVSAWIIDATGIGSALVDLLKREHRLGNFPRFPTGYALTGGRESGPGSVPKATVVSGLITAYNAGRLSFAAGVPIIADLIRELAAYTPEVSADGRIRWGNDSSLSEYDDTVIALGLALLHPRYGGDPRYIGRDGKVYASQLVSPDPY